MNLIPIVYVGQKESAVDNVAFSGKVWAGNGDVQEVTHAQAKALLKHPKVWQLAEPQDAPRVEAPIEIVVKDEDGESVAIDDADLRKPLERMSKAELTALAFSRWGKHLDSRKPTKLLIDQIEEWIRDEPEVRR